MSLKISDSLYTSDKESKYREAYTIIDSILKEEVDLICNMANISALLKELFSFLWVGFYRVVGKELVLGPFQGPLACSRIAFGKGVCGTAWLENKTLIVPDVEEFPGHIACSSRSRSEIVIPLVHENQVWGVLDIDSQEYDAFDSIDRNYLEKMAALLNNPDFAGISES